MTDPSAKKAPATKSATAKKAASRPADQAVTAVDPSPQVDGPTVGQLVSVTAFDPYEEPAGRDVTRHGIVVERAGDTVRLCWLPDGPTDPIDITDLD